MIKPLKNFEGLYEIDELGNIFSLRKHRKMSPVLINSGYYTVKLSKNGKLFRYLIHRLVAENFISNPNNLPCVNHKDEDKTNNTVSNLEWCTYEYNSSYGTRNKRISDTKSIAIELLDLKGNVIKQHKSMKDAAYSLGLSREFAGNISNACRDNTTYKGFKWRKLLN